ncbi:MAG: ABC transporter substrate-binding protein [Rhodospirillales bacterium]|nr:ABC transporter substrate-binding protein [Rhodospirillales bacterium]MDE2198881.1 ABC transporter substrate-binding protein [Rhodospirillales bacterium]MDE2574302.1 ABC transporter substrate-binding protein [Rhodospirillales bacterium]
MQRRDFLLTAAASLAMPAIARGADAKVLKFVPDADLASIDPVWTTSYQTRDHGFLVYDTLFGTDAQFGVKPQMVEGFTVDADKKLWTLKLRSGLKFHDGEPVLARDCIASIARWGKRDAFGQALMAAIDAMTSPDDRTIAIRLKYPFALLPDALSKTAPSMCPIMPARIAATDAFKQITDPTGSGPYRFKADERVPGARAVYERNPDYLPRQEPASRTAGGKIAHFERIEWVIMQDPGTASAALQQGEIDWWYTPSADLLPLLGKSAGVKVDIIVPTGTIATMRFNQLQPPFDNPAIRRAMLGAINQADYMIAVMGDDKRLWHDHVGYFCPNTPMASDAGMTALTSPRNLDQVKRNLAAAGYKGERVVLLAPMNIASTKALAEVTGDLFKKIGLNLDFQAMDWASVVQRRVSQAPVDKGGWSVFQTSWSGLDQFNPAAHVFLRGNGKDAAPGWPTSPKLESLRNDWFRAADLASQKKICEQMQLQAFHDVPYIPLGQTIAPTAFRGDLADMLDGLPLFWNIRRA